MGFAGNLQTLALAEVLQTLSRIHGSGVLRLASANGGREVVFANGDIIGVDLKDDAKGNALLRLMIALGKIDANKAASISEAGGGSHAVLDALVQRGLASASDVQEVQAKQSLDELYDLWTWDFGDFVFAEAGADAQATEAVERWRKSPLKVNLNSLLMESARRQDEWTRLRARFEKEDWVLTVEPGQEEQIAQASAEYPASAVLPLIDGVRSVNEVVKASVATRLDAYAVIADQLDLGTLHTCEREDLLAFADHLADQGDVHRSADLYRKVLARKPDDPETIGKLEALLKQTDQFPIASVCYQQLALAQLTVERGADALVAAKRAVELAPQTADARLALVRCQIEGANNAEAIGELRKVVFIYQKLGRLEDARSTCLKILELDPSDKEVHQDLAKIFAKAENDPGAEDVLVCAKCGEVNDREATACKGCAAKLRLSCAQCGRTIAVSDRLCIFCGADPGLARKILPSSPATSRLIDSGKVRKDVAQNTQSWRSKLEALVKEARAKEANDDLAGALAAWKDAAAYQVDNVELSQHIRRLEGVIHERFIEGRIEQGHKLRGQRRFFRAARCYQAALRTMAANDDRSTPLRTILISTERQHLRVSVLYGISAVILVFISVLVAKPFIQERRFDKRAAAFTDRLAALEAKDLGGALAGVPAAGEELAAMAKAVDEVRPGKQKEHVRGAYDVADGLLAQTRSRVAQRALDDADKVAAKGDHLALGAALATLKSAIPDADPQRVAALEARRKELADIAAERAKAMADAPGALKSAKDAEQKGELGTAWQLYASLARIGHPQVSPEAQAGVERLRPSADAFKARWEHLAEVMDQDLIKAKAELAAMADDAKAWSQEAAALERGREIDRRLDVATKAWRALPENATEEALRAFVDGNKGAPQVLQARTRIAQVVSTAKAREQALAKYRQAMQAQDLEEWWKQARGLLAEHKASLQPGEVLMPLRVASIPIGASVALDGVDQGQAPVVLKYDPSAAKEVRVTLAGHKPATRAIADLGDGWEWAPALEREASWTVKLGRPPSIATVGEDGRMLIGAGDVLVCLDHAGKELWRRPVLAGDDLVDSARVRLPHAPVAISGGRFAFGLADHGMVVIDSAGHPVAQYPTQDTVRGAPSLFVNQLLGGNERLAFGAEALITVVDDKPSPLPISGGVVAGPLPVARGLDCALIVATLAGHLLAIEASTRAVLWDENIGASDVGQLVPTADGGAVAVLDGARLCCFDVAGDRFAQRWKLQLSAAPIGDPIVVDGVVCLACGNEVVRRSLTGTSLPSLPLPSPATSPVAAGDGRLAVGCKNGELAVFIKDKPAWTNPCGQSVTLVCIAPGLVVAGLADGTLTAFAP